MADLVDEHEALKQAHASSVRQVGEWEERAATFKGHSEEATLRQRGTYREYVVLQVTHKVLCA